MPLPNGLVAQWKLNETAGTSAADSVGGYNGTLVNTPTWTTGKIGGGLQLDGTSQYVTVADSDSLDVTAVTISLWFQVTATLGVAYILAKMEDSDSQVAYSVYKGAVGNNLVFAVSDTGGNVVGEITTSGPISSINTWYYLACSYSATASPRYNIYVNAVRQTSDAGGAATGAITIGTGRCVFGARYDSSETVYKLFLGGKLDDIRIYNRALSLPEILAVYNGGYGTEDSIPGHQRLRERYSGLSVPSMRTRYGPGY